VKQRESSPLVRSKWRPSLAMIVFATLATVLALPLGGMAFLQLQTRPSLTAQSVVAAVIVAMTTMIGFMFWRTVTRPMRALIETTRDIGFEDRSAIRAPSHHGTRELAMLSQSFLEMADRLYDRSDYIATFAAHVSHELKSPLSSIRGAAELLRDSTADMSDQERQRFLSNIVGDTARLSALVERLRELARADNPQIGGTTTIASLIASLRQGHPGLRIAAEGCLDTLIRMSRDNALIVFSHLIDNAAQHKARAVHIEAKRSAEAIVVTVRNDGEPISENNCTKIFIPFFTTRREAGGTGMGLAIVNSMLRAHRGAIRLLPAESGAAFEVTLWTS
jgi:two-component system, OmpR family, sensor histidine kinase CreC